MKKNDEQIHYLIQYKLDSFFGKFYCYFSENGLYQMLLDEKVVISNKFKDKIKVVKLKEAPKKTSEIAQINFEILKKEMNQYFDKKFINFSVLLDFSFYTDFQKKVLNYLQKIPVGKVESYKEVAINIGTPNANRAVGNAVGSNRTLIVIPCHRVIKSDGSAGWFGGYRVGTELKKNILKHEGIKIK